MRGCKTCDNNTLNVFKPIHVKRSVLRFSNTTPRCATRRHGVAFSGSYDGTAGLWDLQTGVLLRRLTHPPFPDDDNEVRLE